MLRTPLHYQPDARGLLGFRLGTPLDNQATAVDTARACGFTGAVDVAPGAAGQFILQRGADPVDTLSVDSGLFLECDATGILTRLAFALAIRPKPDTSRDAAHAAEQLVDFLDRELGTPTIRMDNIEAWSREPLFTSEPSVAYSAIWQPKEGGADAGPGVLPIQPDVEAFVAAVRDGCSGHVALVSITAGQGSVVALLELKTLPTTSSHDALASFFNRAHQKRDAMCAL